MAQLQWTSSKRFVQNDCEVFLTPIQNGSFFTKISSKENSIRILVVPFKLTRYKVV
jgi:hypothetical protein